MNLGNVAIVCTAWRRPQYLAATLDSWSKARGISEVRQFTVALGWTDHAMFTEQVEVIDAARRSLGCKVRVKPDSSAARAARGMGRAIGEAVAAAFADPSVEFVICGEEDIVVSTDTLEYMAWAAEEFRPYPRVLAVCAHSVGAQGWDVPGIGQREDPDADPAAVRLIPYFNPWVWGMWRDRWERTLKPRWDWACDSGDAMTSGYDWHIATRIIPEGGYTCAVPLTSRSQNIGKDGGWAADPAQFEATQAASFRTERPACTYKLAIEKGEAAA